MPIAPLCSTCLFWIPTMTPLRDLFCGASCFLRSIVDDEVMTPSASINVLLFTTNCVVPHLVKCKTDAYLGLDSIWNMNIDRLLGSDFVCFCDYSEHSFRVQEYTGQSSLLYKYTTWFLLQESTQVVNPLFTSLCCNRMGVWFGNVIVLTHESGSSKVLNVSWNANDQNFE